MAQSNPPQPAAEAPSGNTATIITRNFTGAVIQIDRPEPGAVKVIDAANAGKLAFTFALTDARFVALDIDLVIVFPDGSKIILPGLALDLVGPHPPGVTFLDVPTEAAMVVAMIGDVKVTEDFNNVSLVSASDGKEKQTGVEEEGKKEKEAKADEEPPADENPPPPPQKTIVSLEEFTSNKRFDDDATSREPPSVKQMKDQAQSSSSSSAPSTSSAPPNPKTATREGLTNEIVASLDIKLLSDTTTTSVNNAFGGKTIGGAFAGGASGTDPIFAVQQTNVTLAGTSSNDIIYADNPAKATAGTSVRVIDANIVYPYPDWKGVLATITGLPAGYAVVNGVKVGSDYQVQFNINDPNHLRIELRYVLPADGTTPDGNGFLSTFDLNLNLLTETTAGVFANVKANRTFGIRDVTDASEAAFTEPGSGKEFNVLWANPPGKLIDASDGADTVYSGAGADTIHGGNGSDIISYSQSQSAVNVDLSTNAVSGGFARGDQIDGFEGVIGTTMADTLKGTTGDNTIDGKGGADIVIADDGNDLVSFYATEASIAAGLGNDTLVMRGAANVNLAAGDQTSGDTTSVSGFENVDAHFLKTGISVAGTNSANTITGGEGNDTIDGGDGADVIDAAQGDDKVFLTGSSLSVAGGTGSDLLVLKAQYGISAVDLSTGGDQTTGDSVFVTGFESLDASVDTSGVSVTASAAANTITTGSGADTIDGGGGGDVIVAGSGDDVVISQDTEVSIAGGVGNDMLVLAAQGGVTLIDLNQTIDQTIGDLTIVKGFESVDASVFTAGDALSVVGTSGANTITTGDGADSVDGRGGQDVIVSGQGNDKVLYYASEASIDGGGGANTLILTTSAAIDLTNTTDQTLGDAVVVTNFQNIDGSALGATQSLNLIGTSAANTLSGGAGEDTIDGAGGLDVLWGGGGNDLIMYRGGEAVIDGSTGSDTLRMLAAGGTTAIDLSATSGDQTVGDSVTVLGFENLTSTAVNTAFSVLGSSAANTISTGGGDDTIDAGAGRDYVSAGAGNDRVTYTSGAGSLSGGNGQDTIVLLNATTVNLQANADQTIGDTVAVRDFESVDASALTSSQGVSITGIGTGADADNTLIGGAGADTIDGAGGADSVVGGFGNDIVTYYGSETGITGNSGIDLLVMAQQGSVTVVDLSSGGDQTTGDGFTVSGFESLDANSITGNLSVVGGTSANTVTTGSGADSIDAGGGVDVINSGGGNDTVASYGSESSIQGGAGTEDLVVLRGIGTLSSFNLGSLGDQSTGDTVNIAGFESLDASLLSAAQPLLVTGSAAANTITTGAGADTIDGAGGADSINAGSGNDRVIDRGTESALDGGIGNDLLVVLSQANLTSVDLSSGTDQTLGDSVTVQRFESVDASQMATALSLTGTGNANSIIGGTAADTIDGIGGGDVIDGGAGNDVISLYGTEMTVAGNTGISDTLVLMTSSLSIDLGQFDQSINDSAVVTGFENVDGTGLGQGVLIAGSSGINKLLAGTGDDTIDGGGGADTVSAGNGNDQVIFYGTEGLVDGGVGNDLLVFKPMAGLSAINLTSLTDQTTGDGSTVKGFESIDASLVAQALSVTGTTAANTITSGSGADTIDGKGGADIINASSGNDTVLLYGAEVRVDGGGGNDTLKLNGLGSLTAIDLSSTTDQTIGDTPVVVNFTSLNATVLAAGENLSVTGSTGANTISTGTGADTIDAGAGADVVAAGAGNDVVSYVTTASRLDGEGGIDTLVLKAAANVDLSAAGDQTSGDGVIVTNFEQVDASQITNTGVVLTGQAGVANTLIGGGGADTIDGKGGLDFVFGAGGDDLIMFNGSEGTLAGGTGNDLLQLVVQGGITSVDLGSATDQTTGDSTVVQGFEGINATVATASMTVKGTAGANTITTGSGADSIDGLGGTDIINAGGGDDTVFGYASESSIQGGAGNDLLVLKVAGALFSVDLGSAGDQTTGDTVAVGGFESLDASILTSQRSLSVLGTAGANTVTTGAGADTIDFLGGLDVLDGGQGNDRITSWGSETSIDAGTGGTDTLVLKAQAGLSAIDLTAAGDQTSGDTVNVQNFESVDASAMTTAMSVLGTSTANTITGGTAADTIDAGGFTDVVDGGAGNDLISLYGTETSITGGSSGTDTLLLKSAVTVNLGAFDQTIGDNAQVTSFENVDGSLITSALQITATSIANTISGGSNNDTIDGGGGADTIFGGAGEDRITGYGTESQIDGGAQNDTLVLKAQVGLTGVNLGSAGDQTVGDGTTLIKNFESIDTSLITQALSVAGSTGDNTITTGGGADTIRGQGGLDVIVTGGGNDLVFQSGNEASIDGGTGSADQLVLGAQAGITAIDLTSLVDQTTGDGTTVSGFENVDASVLTNAQAVSIVGTTGANSITSGAGADTIDAGGGLDVVKGNGGDDVVAVYGTETSIDGGTGVNTLMLARSGFSVNLGNAADQTTGDTGTVTAFQNVDASLLTLSTQGVSIAGSSLQNTITGGAGNDTIDGGAGADSISGGAGNDRISLNGGETTIDAGGGTDMLVLKAQSGITTINLGSAGDQTTGDTVTVTGFESADASVATAALTINASGIANTVTGGSGADTIDAGGGADVIDAGSGINRVSYYGTESSIATSGASGTLLLKVGGTINLSTAADQTSGDSAVVTGFTDVDGSALSAAQNARITGTTGANTLSSGAGADTIDGNGGADVITAGSGDDRVSYNGSETSIDAQGGSADILVLKAASAITSVDLSALGADQTGGDAVSVLNFESIDASVQTGAMSVLGANTNNTITTGSGADTIDGAGGIDVIVAGGGNDFVSLYGTETSIDGGAGGVDTLVLMVGTTVNLTNATDQTIGDVTKVTNFENVDTSNISQGVSILGTGNANTITGGAGADTIDGNGGADVIRAGGQDDVVYYNATEASIDAESGSGDLLILKSQGTITAIDLTSATDQTTGDSVVVKGFEGVDAQAGATGITITASAAQNLITGTKGNDVIDAGGGADTIDGFNGNDRIAYYGSESSISGGTGTNTLVLKTASIVDLAASDVTVGDGVTVALFQSVDGSGLSSSQSFQASGTTGANTILGGSGADTIDGIGGADSIAAGAGNDVVAFNGAEGALDGGTGSDLLVLNAQGNVTSINFGSGTDQTTGDTVKVTGFESLDASILGALQALSVAGTAGANTITTGAGADTIDGLDGSDVIAARDGDDRVSIYGNEGGIDGGIGNDTLVLKTALTVDLRNGDQTTGDTPTVSNFESIDASGLAATGVMLTGSNAANSITGGGGADTIDGTGQGADVLKGGGGNDLISLWGTETSVDGGANLDTLLLRANVNVNLALADQTAGDTPTVTAFENVDARALLSGISIAGSTSVNSIWGSQGADTIDGAGGADAILAGTGNDRVSSTGAEASIDGGDNADTLVLKAQLGLTAINLNSQSDQTTGDVAVVINFENLDASTLTASQGIVITGTLSDNAITGGAGNDTIDGKDGADSISGGGGDDRVFVTGNELGLDGGTGNDTLVLVNALTVDLSNATDQTSLDTAVVKGFEHVDANSLSSSVTLVGSTGANTLRGGGGADSIDGKGGADFIQSGGGDDTVAYYGGENSIDGGSSTGDLMIVRAGATLSSVNLGSGTDQTGGDTTTVTGFESVDTSAVSTAMSITASNASNTITTGAGADTIDAGGGVDLISSGAGNDRVVFYGTESGIDGGGQNDTLVMKAVATVDLSNVADQTGTDTPVVTGFSSVDASSLTSLQSVFIKGSTGANTLLGSQGADTIDGLGGSDSIDGGSGDDLVSLNGGETAIKGGAGNDVLVLNGQAGITVVNLTSGTDQTTGDTATVTQFEGLDASVLTAGQALSVVGGATANTITTGAGADTIDAGGGADVIQANDGDDRVAVYGTEVSVNGGSGAGNDWLVLKNAINVDLSQTDQTTSDTAAVSGFDNVDASSATTTVRLAGNAGANTMLGGTAGDTIYGGSAGDVLDGQGGADFLYVNGSEASIIGGAGDYLGLLAGGTVDLAAADQTVGDTAVTTGFSNVYAWFSGAAVSVSGNSATNSIWGSQSADTIDGKGGSDSIFGYGGDDIIYDNGTEAAIDGGLATDTLILRGFTGITSVNLSLGTDQTAGDTQNILGFESIDFSTHGATQAVTVTGSLGSNSVTAGAGNDSIDGLGGADAITGNGGNDTVAYYGTESAIDGGGQSDLLIVKAATAINLALADQTVGDSTTVTGFRSVTVSGLTTGISIAGDSNANTIVGSIVGDTIDGAGGADSINAGSGDDIVTYRGGEVSIDGNTGTGDTLVLAAQGGITNVNLASLTDQTTGDTVTVAGFENLDGTAVSGAMSVSASSSANTITMGVGADTIDAGGGADLLKGGAGDDVISYYGSENSIDGEGDNNTLLVKTNTTINLGLADQTSGDTVTVANFQNVDASAVINGTIAITGSSVANTIIGGAQGDLLDGGAGGGDVIKGGGGDDTINLYGNEVLLDGQGGTDNLVLKAFNNITSVNFSSGTDQTTGDTVTTLGFEHLDARVFTTGQGLSVTGTSGWNSIQTGAGNDTIDGNGSNADNISAGAGDDLVSYYGGGDLGGGAGNDTLVVKATAPSYAIVLSNGGDQTTGDAGIVTGFESVDASATALAYTIYGTGSANTIKGGSSADTIDGLGGLDSISAGGGNDSVMFYGSESSIDGGTGTGNILMPTTSAYAINLSNAADQTSGDTAVVTNFQGVDGLYVLSGFLSVTGTTGADTIFGGWTGNTIDGKGGADVLSGRNGNDTIFYYGTETSISGGQLGSDMLVLQSAVNGLSINLNNAATDQTTGDTTVVQYMTGVDGSAISNSAIGLSLTGRATADTLIGGAGNDTISGSFGPDVLLGGGGNDRMSLTGTESSIDGGTGTNILVYTGSSGSLNFNLASATDQTTGDSAIVKNFLSLDAAGTSSSLTVAGTSAANTIATGSGSDTIDGAGGGDCISGGSGGDTIKGYTTDVFIDGGSSNDLLIFTAQGALSALDLSNATDQTTGDTPTVRNFESFDGSVFTTAVTVTGSSSANSMTSGSGNDSMTGGGGGDYLFLNGGADTVGYVGTEVTIDGGTGNDLLILTAQAGMTSVNLSTSGDQTTNDTVVVKNFEHLDASAATSALTITGSAIANTITGGSGNNSIDGGGAGADVIVAGVGADTIANYGVESSLDGGAGSADMVVIKAQAGLTSINLAAAANADQTTGDGSLTVKNFENVDASALTQAFSVTGTSGTNTITSGSGADTIDGGGGADMIVAGGGADRVGFYGTETSIDGGASSNLLELKAFGNLTAVVLNDATDITKGDTVLVQNFDSVDASVLGATQGISITGTSNANSITGGAGNDTIDGLGSTDRIDAGGGNDNVNYYATENSITGGTGVNTLVLKTGAIIDLSSGTDQSSGDSTTVTLFQHVLGTGLSSLQNSSITGSSSANTITMGAGGDTIDGSGGADVVDAGSGNDRVTLNGAETTLEAGAGSDLLVLAAQNGISSVNLTVANSDQTTGDSVTARNFEGVDASVATTAMSVLGGSATANTISTGAGNDTIDGGGGVDVLSAGSGDDRVNLWGAETSIDGGANGAAGDTLVLKTAATVNLLSGDQTTGDSINVQNFENVDGSGLSTSLSLTGSTVGNVLTGGSVADTLDGGTGADTLIGGAGSDIYIVDSASDVVTENASSGTDTVQTSALTSVTLASYANVENLTYTGAGNFSGTGTSGANVLTGSTGADTLDGATGLDTLVGGAGSDVYVLYTGTETVTELAGGGTADTVQTSALTALSLASFTNVENLTYTGAGNFSGTGDGNANVLTGSTGADTLDGGAGTDTLVGGSGNDVYVVDSASDVVTEGVAGGIDLIRTSVTALSLANYSNVENLTYTGSSAFSGVGDNNANLLTGSTAADTLDGGAGVDTLVGGTGNDVYIVDSASDVVTEGAAAGNDTVQTANLTTLSVASYTNVENLTYTGSGNFSGTGDGSGNVLTSSTGDDTLDGGAGVDTLVGGAGNDLYLVDSGSDVVTEGAAAGTDTVQTANLTTLSLASYTNVENLTYTGSGNFSGTGNSSANVLTGSTGADTLDGGTGTDTLVGGAGNDIYLLDNAGDTITEGAGAGIDTAQTSSLTAVSLASFTNVENLTYTGAGNFSGTGDGNGNVITASTGADTLDGGAGVDTLVGGTGNDVYIVDSASDVVTEGAAAGNDTVQTANLTTLSVASYANVENLTYTGSGNFSGTGDGSGNVLTSNTGDDTLDGGAGVDTLVGGAGNDLYLVDSASDVVTEGAAAGTDTVQTANLTTLSLASYTNVENLTYTGSGNFSGTGNSSANVLTGSTGADTLDGGTGTDTLVGGAGNDVYLLDNAGDTITEGAGAGIDTAQTSSLTAVSLASFTNVENLTYTGSGNFSGTGDGNGNVLTASTGADTLDGGAGVDTLVGGTGNDVYIVDSASDVVTEGAAAGNDTVQTANLTTLSVASYANVENLTYTGSGNFSGTGDGSGNVLTSSTGDDTLDGGAGVDTLVGGAGNDLYLVDSASDVVTEGAAAGTDTVQTANLTTLSLASYTNVENLTYTGSGNFSGTGNSSANVLTGSTGADTLDGGAGVDTLVGGSGNDVYLVDNASDVVTEGAAAGIDTVQTTNLTALALASYANVENLTYTGAGNVSLTGDTNANVLTGNTGADTLDGNGGSDTLVGGSGNDTYVLTTGTEVVTDSAGAADTIRTSSLTSLSLLSFGSIENLTYAGAGNFSGTGNALANTISGSTGNDTLDGGTGADALVGGTGDDLYLLDSASDTITEAAASGIDTAQTSVLTTLALANFANVENLAYTGSGNFSGLGDGAGNQITGNTGNDTLDGGAGVDTLIGGSGNDVYIVDSASDVVTEGAAAGIDTVQTSLLTSLGLAGYANVENITYTGSGNFSGVGNGGANLITGSSGDDTLDGNGGSDTLVGGGGNDTYILYTGSEVVTEGAAGGTDTISTGGLLSFSLAGYTNIENLTYTGSGNFSGTGNTSGNVITGSTGNDTLDGGTGADTLAGGSGDDTYLLDNAGDVVTEGGGGGTDTILTSSLTSIDLGSVPYANVENVTYTGVGNVSIAGTSAANALTGAGGSDTLDGGSGGSDTLNGGGGADTFKLDASSLSMGAVVDGGAGSDTLVVSTTGGAFNSTDLVNATSNIETIDFTQNASAAVSLSGLDIQKMTDSNANLTLKIDLGSDSFNLDETAARFSMTGPGANAVGTTVYTIYNDDSLHDAAHTIAQLTVIAA